MRNPLKRRPTTGIHEMMRIYRCLTGCKPDERDRDIGPLPAKLGKRLNRNPMQTHRGCRHNRKDRAPEQGGGEPHNIAWQHCIENLSSSLVQQREAETEPAFDEVQGFVLVALDDDVLPLLHSDPAIECTAEGFQILPIDMSVGHKLDNERMIPDRPILGGIGAGSPLDAHSEPPQDCSNLSGNSSSA